MAADNWINKLYFGDNLVILRDHIPDETVDLIYLDPPFNSKASYNILYKENSGDLADSQIHAFEDTWHWGTEAESTFKELTEHASPHLVDLMLALRSFLGQNDMMAYLTMMAIRLIELHRVLKPTGSLYLHCDPTASHYLKLLLDGIFGHTAFRNEIIWCYRKWSVAASQFARNHDIILFYSRSTARRHYFNTLYTDISTGTKRRWKGQKQHAYFEDGTRKATSIDNAEARTPMPDWWPISIINPNAAERLGYQTQKPEALLERILLASCPENGLVLDPFCGCGTSVAVAERLQRRWIGIDITHLAISLIQKRLQDTFGRDLTAYDVEGVPKDLESARVLALLDRYQFEYWALSLVNARPAHDKRKGADTGIDGIRYFRDDKSETAKKIVVQVKSGHVQRRDIGDFKNVIEREKAAIGFFVTLEEPTTPMKKEAAVAGFYEPDLWKGKDHRVPKLQLLTIKELLNGKRPDIPEFAPDPTFKTAPRKSSAPTNGDLAFDEEP